jgi:DNA-binding transcriptional ArsR family regulator
MAEFGEHERQQEVLRLLDGAGRVSVQELASRFGVSLVTVRKDLEALETAVLAALDAIRGERGLPPADRRRFLRVYDDLRRSQDGSLRGRLAAEFLGVPEERDLLHERTCGYWRYPKDIPGD